MTVVSNTSPLNYLVLIDSVELLASLYGTVTIPTAVAGELTASGSPAQVRRWAMTPPAWLKIREPAHVDPSLCVSLHAGEAHALALALEVHADLILMDERRGTAVARSVGLKPIGLVGCLDVAAAEGLVRISEVLDRLSATNFRMTRALRDYLVQRDVQRGQGSGS